MAPADFRQIRGNDIAMIFQEPMTSLNPAYTVGNQIAEQVRTHRHLSKAESWKVAVDMLERVEIPQAAARAHDYPHAFSGGMRQRVMIAMALSCSPKLLIADEPTTALDVTTEAQIVDLLHTLQREEDMAMIFVTHDLGVIADVADDVVVMYAGQIVEQTDATALFTRPRHPYTEALMTSVPQLTPRGEPLHAIPGMVPRPGQFPPGCRFNPRCQYATEACVTTPVGSCPPANGLGSTNGARAGMADTRSGGPRPQHGPLSRCLRQDELNLAGARAVAEPVGVTATVPLTGSGAHRSWWSRGFPSNSRCAAGCCSACRGRSTRSTGWTSPSTPERRSGWSARAARASRPWPGWSPGS